MTFVLAAWEIAKRIFGLLPLKDWLILAAVGALLGYHVVKVHEARKDGYTDGFEASNQQCEMREKAAQEDYEKRAKEAEEAKKAHEEEQATELAAIGVQHAQEMKDAQDTRDRDVALARSGALKLRVAGMCPRAAPGDPAAQAATAAAGRDDPAGADLPPAVAGSLLGIADDADATVKQLGACQAVVNSYLKGST